MRHIAALVVFAVCACAGSKDAEPKAVINASYGARLFASFLKTGSELQCTATPVAADASVVTFITASFCVREGEAGPLADQVEIEFPKRSGGHMRLFARVTAVNESLAMLAVVVPDIAFMPEISRLAAAFPPFDGKAKQKPPIAARACYGNGCAFVTGTLEAGPRAEGSNVPGVATAEAALPSPDGSAGSGVFDQSGRLIGIVWGRTAPDRPGLKAPRAIIVPVDRLHRLVETKEEHR